MKHCPICDKNVEMSLSQVPTSENTDPLGRRQFLCSGTEPSHVLFEADDGKLEPAMEGEEWNSNLVQFPRLLAEIWGVGLKEKQYSDLHASMGLNPEEIESIFERADFVFERDKELTFNPKAARWVIYGHTGPSRGEERHIRVQDSQNPAQEITICNKLPFPLRLYIARQIAYFLNTDARTR